jgi:hypothetical protein
MQGTLPMGQGFELRGTGEATVTHPILDSRKQWGTNPTPSDFDIVKVGNQWVPIQEAVEMGYLFKTTDGAYHEYSPKGAFTRVDA